MSRFLKNIMILLGVLLLAACSITKYVPDDEYLLDKVEIKSEDKGVNISLLDPFIRQRSNAKWFSLYKVPLRVYSLSGQDTTKWINRTLRKIGEEPVIYDSLQALQTCNDLRLAMQDMGYMNAQVNVNNLKNGKKIKTTYNIVPGSQYKIGKVHYDIADDSIASLGFIANPENWGLHEGQQFTISGLDAERKNITKKLADQGFYRFNKDFINYTVDTVKGSDIVDVTLHLMKYRANNNVPETLHPRYKISSVSYIGGQDGKIHLREKILRSNTWINRGDYYSQSDMQRTYDRIGRLPAVRYTNINYTEIPDTTLLDCKIQVTTGKLHTITFQPEGTNTAGDFGAAASLTYENHNVFRGSETFSMQLRGAYEAITGLEGYQNHDYREYGIESKLMFPRMIVPFLSRKFVKHSQATSELSLGYNVQNRPEYHRRVFSAAWRYRWNNRNKRSHFRLDMLDLNYVNMPWISSTFKNDYLDNVNNKNAILRYNYEDLFIMKLGLNFTYNDGTNAIKANAETSGNFLDFVVHTFGGERNSKGQYTFFNIAYAQYAKFDVDYTKLFHINQSNQFAMHIGIGVAYPYSNSTILPFEKRYFSGGANSVRGWNVRGLGPGSFKGTDGRIDFINQTGDIKLDLNVEYRTYLVWKLYGAAFVDAGNIWTLREYAEQPGGQFDLRKFHKQIAMSYGLGVRLNFDYFILRFDMGMKAVNPAYDTKREHYPLLHPNLKRDFAFHFSVGLPF